MSGAVSVTLPYGPLLLCNGVVSNILFRRVVLTCYGNKSGSHKKKKRERKKKQHCDPGSHSLLVSNYQVEGLFFCEGMLFVMFSSKEN